MTNSVLEDVLEDCTHVTGDTVNVPPGATVTVLPARTACLCAQSRDVAYHTQPSWFVNVACACAYNIRNAGATVPCKFATARDLKLIQIMNAACIRYIIRAIDTDVLETHLQINKLESVGIERDRDTKHSLQQKVKRLQRWRHAVCVATGYGHGCRIVQNSVLKRVYSSSLRNFFATNLNRSATNIAFCGEIFGIDSGLNRCAIPMYEHFLARAIRHVFPWADGYACDATASLWHSDQVYPSEICIFSPASSILFHSEIAEYDEIKQTVLRKRKAQIRSINLPIRNFCYEYVETTENASAPVEVDVPIAGDMESRISYLHSDNPLLNNTITSELVDYCTWAQ
jgi:hypothetical protein